MRIAISLLNLRPGKIGGAETYLRELIPRLPGAGPEHQFVVVAHRDIAEQVAWPGIQVVTVDRSDAEIVRARVLEAFTPYRARFAERALAEIQPDVAFFPQQSLFPKRVAAPVVLTVVDVQHLSLPQNFSLADRLFRAAIYPYSLRRADRILAISAFVRDSLIRLCRVPAERISVTLLGCYPPTGRPDAGICPVEGPFLFFPAASHPHKNHLQLLESVAALRARGAFPYQLVLSGLQTPHWRRIAGRIGQLGLGDVVVHVGYVAPAEVEALYRQTEAVLFPTRYEGFGLPVVEAVAFGKKVIVSRLEVFEEIGVPDEYRIDFGNPDELLRALQLPGPTILQKRPVTWDECAATTLRELLKAAASPHD